MDGGEMLTGHTLQVSANISYERISVLEVAARFRLGYVTSILILSSYNNVVVDINF